MSPVYFITIAINTNTMVLMVSRCCNGYWQRVLFALGLWKEILSALSGVPPSPPPSPLSLLCFDAWWNERNAFVWECCFTKGLRVFLLCFVYEFLHDIGIFACPGLSYLILSYFILFYFVFVIGFDTTTWCSMRVTALRISSLVGSKGFGWWTPATGCY